MNSNRFQITSVPLGCLGYIGRVPTSTAVLRIQDRVDLIQLLKTRARV